MKTRRAVGRKWRRNLRLMGVLLIIWIGTHFAVNRITAGERRLAIVSLPQSAENAAVSDGEISILCYNIAHLRGPDEGANFSNRPPTSEQQERLRNIAKRIAQSNPDLVVLNEVDFDSFWSDNQNQARWLAEELNYPFLAEQRNVDFSIPFLKLEYGNALLSRYPIEHLKSIDFPQQSGLEKTVLARLKSGALCTINVHGRKLGIIPVHLNTERKQCGFRRRK